MEQSEILKQEMCKNTRVNKKASKINKKITGTGKRKSTHSSNNYFSDKSLNSKKWFAAVIKCCILKLYNPAKTQIHTHFYADKSEVLHHVYGYLCLLRSGTTVFVRFACDR